ncbi:MAG: dihydrofolate reductase [Candidatus Nomurabacteria bacterium]|jgi:dihydrofolate reductase|nr:dihydrofolate reductase [Candidatus Nomurabacteria bacterium]
MKRERAVIVAYADNHVIGDRGLIPWLGRMPADMKRVRELTSGQAIIMGQKTFESIGQPLPKRQNIVLSRNLNLREELGKYEENMITQKEWDNFMHNQLQTINPVVDFLARGEVDVAFNLGEAFAMVKPGRTPFVFGGASVYAQTLEQDLVDVIYATEIHGEFSGDTFFPEILEEKWREVEREDFPADNENAFPYSFVKYERRKSV